MRRTPKNQRLAAWILAFCLLLTGVPAVLAAGQTQELQLQEVPVTAEDLAAEPVIVQESDAPQEDEELRVIIIFQDASLLEKGYSTTGLATNSAAMAYRTSLEMR